MSEVEDRSVSTPTDTGAAEAYLLLTTEQLEQQLKALQVSLASKI
jgi:hypothetical protein